MLYARTIHRSVSSLAHSLTRVLDSAVPCTPHWWHDEWGGVINVALDQRLLFSLEGRRVFVEGCLPNVEDYLVKSACVANIST